MDFEERSESGEPHLDHPRTPERTPPRAWPRVALLVALLAILGGGAWYFLSRGAEPPAEPAPADETEEGLSEREPPAARPAPEPELPPLDASDAVVRELVGRLSAHPRLMSWLATDDLVRRFVAAVDNVAEGVSPKTHLPFLVPEEGFRVEDEGGRLTLDPTAYRRYDLLADVVVSLDTEGTVRLYRRLEPLMDQAYRDLGYPERDFEDALAKAVGRLLDVPAVEGEIALQPQAVTYGFADPRLENLSPAAKHLLRMGPANVRRIQAKLRELAATGGIEPR